MRRLSLSIAELKLHYDAIVVGSGYGGGVAASRLARCGKRVAVLERGKEFLLGDFPDRLSEAQAEFQISRGSMHLGSATGLFDLRLGSDMHVLVGCGLGGTSLINANVSLPPDERVWNDAVWPRELRSDDTLKAGYARARAMLRPVPYPNEVAIDKLKAFEASAARLGASAERPPINVTFRRELNHANVMQSECTLCGDCCAGCNVGAKNTVQMTYLADAYNHGADIFCGLRVSHVAPERGRWRVFFETVGDDREKFGAEGQSISGDIVVLGAGALGSTEILLRSRAKGLKISDRIGERFSGNGDAIAFAYNNDVPINGIGVGHPPAETVGPVGPCISGLIDLRKTDRLEDGMVVEEGSIPSGIAPVLPALMAAGATAFGVDTDFGFADEVSEAARTQQSLVFGAYKGAVHHTQTFLVMAHDGSDGRMVLDDDRLKVVWPGIADRPVYQAISKTLKEATAATGGTYVRNPLQSTLLGNNVITVHPLGGCGMGQDRASGVVNHKCQVFNADPSVPPEAVHPGLYVCDGSIIPRSLGVNPLLTISALSERAMIHLARDQGLKLDDAPRRDLEPMIASPDADRDPDPAGVQFTERMTGFVSDATVLPHETAAAKGRDANQPLSFTVTVLIDDVDAFVSDREHTGRLVGTVDCPWLSPQPLDIYNGTFNLMRADKAAVETKRFDYRFSFGGHDGKEYLFEGYKIVRSDAGLDLWRDTTLLYVDIRKERDGSGGPLGRGLLEIPPTDFITQMQTLKGTGGRNKAEQLAAAARFGKFFSRELFDTYGGLLARTGRYDDLRPRKKRALRVPVPEVHHFKTKDGTLLRLTRYRGGNKGPLIFAHGLGVSSLIFSIDTIDTNMLEYMVAAGYDCWLLDFRASVDLPSCRQQWTGDVIATQDYPEAVAKVRALTGASSVQMIAHCFGATTFTMALLAGLAGVRSAVISQISTDYVVPFFPQRLLAYLRAPALFDTLGIDVVNARATKSDRLPERVLDWALRLIVPVPRKERTHNATSTRISGLYGRLYQLEQLNEATFNSGLAEMFGEANITAFKQLALMAREQRLLAADGSDDYLPHVRRMALPILFIHGAKNACFLPESTIRTVERLGTVNGPALYERREIDGHGHIDCIFGKDAARLVYPYVLRHLELTAGTGGRVTAGATTV